MFPTSRLPKPLNLSEFYILLGLCRGASHRYLVKSYAYNDSLGSINLNDSQIYRGVEKLHALGYLDLVSVEPGRKASTKQLLYETSELGRIRLQEEILRLEHAVKIANQMRVINREVPTDIQRIVLAAGIKPKA